MMNKKLVSMAVAAALVGGVGAAQAVHLNPDGLGQVLLYPFYSVEGGNDTYIQIVNTTNETKAVKVRFLEAMNSQEVLDFNLYLSPEDHWSAWIGPYSTVANGETVHGAILRTSDNSCTVPRIPDEGVPFRLFEYAADSVNGLDRTREGYVEIIEMGVVEGEFGAAAVHGADGVPADCAKLRSAWAIPSGTWTREASVDIARPTGGLYGYGVLINVDEGTNASYDAVALDNFAGRVLLHTNPGSVLPSLNSGTIFADIIDGNEVYSGVEFDRGIDAVSAVLMRNALMNDYVTDPLIAAETDWVVTFPTKRFYVNQEPALSPFTASWDRRVSRACEPVEIAYWDREEQEEGPDDVDFSPQPPGVPPQSLCYEANVVTVNGSNALYPSERVRRNVDLLFKDGWLRMGLDAPGRFIEGTIFGNGLGPKALDAPWEQAFVEFRGLPVVGFGVQKYVNGNLGGLGVLSNYAGLINHKYTREINVYSSIPD